MVNKSKNLGTAWETAVVRYLNDCGFPLAERRTLSGRYDRGDISGIPDVVIECKTSKQISLPKWMDETETERVNDDSNYGMLVIKRRQRGISDAYVVLPLWQAVRLLRDVNDPQRTV